ncbi:MAG: choice-of-anchor Q domain-containing protein, partial [Gemmatimonadales bacterium]
MSGHLRFMTLLALLLGPLGAGAAMFTVNSAVDAPDATPGDGLCETAAANGVCTLRAGIGEANALAGDDTVSLPAGTYPAPAGGLVVSSNLTLDGAGAITTVLEGGAFGAVLEVQVAAEVTVRRLTVANGRGLGIRNRGMLGLGDCTVRGNAPGGISNSGTLTLTRTLVTQNFGGLAGGLLNETGATATVVDSVLSYNFGAPYGGVFNNSGGMATVTGSAVIGNLGDGVGNAGTLVMTNSTVSGNHVGTSAVRCTFDQARIELANVTIADNATAISSSDAVGIAGPCSSITVRNSLIAGNHDRGAERNCGATLTSQGHNLIRAHPGTPCVIQGDTTGNITDRDPLLGPLTDNRGPTPTHALLPGSPAIDAGDPAVCAATDQRGVARPQGDRCDIGAYEAGGPPPPPPPPPTRFIVDDTGMAPDAYPGDGFCRTAAGTCTLTAAMLEAQALPGTDTIELDAATYTLDRIDHEEFEAVVGRVALPTVTSDLTIVGKGAALTRIERVPAGAPSRVVTSYSVQAGALTLRGLTFAGPSAGPEPRHTAIYAVLAPVTVEDSVFTGSYNAGSILIWNTRLTLRRVAFREYAADPAFGSGPTLITVNSGGLDVDECTFEDNTLSAIHSFTVPGEPHTITRSTFRDNTAKAAVVVAVADPANVLDVSDSLFEGNVNSFSGSGAAALSGARTITRCTFRGNQTGGHGGALETLRELSVTD